jgi:hypothetical protein
MNKRIPKSALVHVQFFNLQDISSLLCQGLPSLFTNNGPIRDLELFLSRLAFPNVGPKSLKWRLRTLPLHRLTAIHPIYPTPVGSGADGQFKAEAQRNPTPLLAFRSERNVSGRDQIRHEYCDGLTVASGRRGVLGISPTLFEACRAANLDFVDDDVVPGSFSLSRRPPWSKSMTSLEL